MNTKIEFTIEAPNSLTIDELETLKQMARDEATTFNTLDAVQTLFSMVFADKCYFVYRGGHHVALLKNGTRVALVVEPRPESEVFRSTRRRRGAR